MLSQPGEVPAGLMADQAALCQQLLELGQSHLYADWPAAGEEEEGKAALLSQLDTLNSNYPGGLAAYVASARKLLSQSQRGDNPLGGWVPSVPTAGFDLEPGGGEEFAAYERSGLLEAAQ